MDDFVLTVRQIYQYPELPYLPSTKAAVLVQYNTGAYYHVSAAELVANALADGGFWLTAPPNFGVAWGTQQAGIFAELAYNGDLQTVRLTGAPLHVTELEVEDVGRFGEIICAGPIYLNTSELVATQDWVQTLLAPIYAGTVHSFNGKTGEVFLDEIDILKGGGAPINNPTFHGYVRAPEPWDVWDNTDLVPTTSWVQKAICANMTGGFTVQSFNGRTGKVVLSDADVTAACTAVGAQPQTVTPPLGDSSLAIANTAWVMSELPNLGLYAPIDSPQFTGYPAAPTAPAGTNSGQLATTAFVMAAVAAATTGVSTWNGRTGNVVLTSADVVAAGGAGLASPAFTGNPTAPTAAPGDNDTTIATTAFVHAAIAAIAGGVTSFNTRTGAVVLTTADVTAVGGALLASPAFSGIPTAPTASTTTSTTQIATTAFVHAAITASAGAVTSFNGRTGAVTLLASDISAATGALLASPAFTGTPTAPTATAGTSTTQIATTAFVAAAVSGAVAGVTSFNTRTGAVTLSGADISGAGGALLAGPTFTGVPSAPTATAGTNTTQLATTAFVTAAVAAVVGVSTFNGRSGAVSLLGSDVSAAGGALLASPVFSGIPQAPTAAPGNNTQQLATTAFVTAAITAAGGVTSFNSRSGVVTLTTADVTGAGGAPLASPTFTGVPSGPTASPGTNTTQFATTAFVTAAVTASGGVSSFNTRTGAITLVSGDLTAAGGALLASPAFTGTPTVPTATAGTNTTQAASTAFVAAAIAAVGSGVVSFNTRTGAVTLSSADITGAGGALLASPTFTGTPAAPTPAASDNSTTLATTAFVASKGVINQTKIRVITASGSYVPTAGMKYCIVECQGGGGAGGGVTGTASGAYSGGGGASGSYARVSLSAAQVGASQTVTIGAGGTGVTAAAGNPGGDTSFGTLCIAKGGGGGNPCSSTGGATQGGQGGVPVSAGNVGDFTRPGNYGFSGLYYGTVAGGLSVWINRGADSVFGSGAPTVWSNSSGNAAAANSGGGGSGGLISTAATTVNGGSGGSGIVVITEFLSV